VPSDIEIAQASPLRCIVDVATDLGIPADALDAYGRYKAKLSLEYVIGLADNPRSKLILVSAMSPTPAGEGKTTTTVGLGDALHRIGKRVMICVREPSLGPVFGMKGGATGGGRSQVVPMEDINLHFTGDFGAIALAHNLLSALLDNHIYHGNALKIDPLRIAWKRVMDMNDRALRDLTIAQGGPSNGVPRSDGFDIVVASEVMAILCLATSLHDLKERLGNIVIGYSTADAPVRARDLKAHGAMAALLREAIKPNLVQTLEHTPALVHGGPFANMAHGCNSVLATRAGLRMADYVVTEAGFGADLGAEKFIDIKCRKAGLAPAVVVIVATLKALKYHGGADLAHVGLQNLEALGAGTANLERHVDNIKNGFGLPCVVSVNHFTGDTPEELRFLQERLAHLNVPVVSARNWAEGGAGAEDLARAVVAAADVTAPGGAGGGFRFAYDDSLPLWEKLECIAKRIYGAGQVTAGAGIRERVAALQEGGYGHYPICIAKTQYSFSTDPKCRGAPVGHTLNVREVRLAAGAEFIVFVCGDLLTMPGLPKEPAANRIDIDDDGRIRGLF
jgi:formate--tetrahydrofolate ligase